MNGFGQTYRYARTIQESIQEGDHPREDQSPECHQYSTPTIGAEPLLPYGAMPEAMARSYIEDVNFEDIPLSTREQTTVGGIVIESCRSGC